MLLKFFVLESYIHNADFLWFFFQYEIIGFWGLNTRTFFAFLLKRFSLDSFPDFSWVNFKVFVNRRHVYRLWIGWSLDKTRCAIRSQKLVYLSADTFQITNELEFNADFLCSMFQLIFYASFILRRVVPYPLMRSLRQRTSVIFILHWF